MFPKLHDEMKSLLPQAYFGGEDVPPYMHLATEPGASIEELASSIRAIGFGANSSGYIDQDGIHFHLPDDDIIQVDQSKRFIFVSEPSIVESSAIGGSSPSAWQILRFLEEPVEQALLIVSEKATLISKTPQTLELCTALDLLWAQEQFLATRIMMAESEEGREKGLAQLMKAHEEGVAGSSSEMWEFWGAFQFLLMTEKLHIQVQIFGG